jgi:hypothetical protein
MQILPSRSTWPLGAHARAAHLVPPPACGAAGLLLPLPTKPSAGGPGALPRWPMHVHCKRAAGLRAELLPPLYQTRKGVLVATLSRATRHIIQAIPACPAVCRDAKL